jgi:hypothetical protein
MEDDRSAIITFNIEKVEASQELMLTIFTEMDDGIGMPVEYKEGAAHALLKRILSRKEIHLQAIEADYIKLKAPDAVMNIAYYN